MKTIIELDREKTNFKFTPGQYFKLKPNARITWLVFSNHTGSGIDAIRVDTELGQKMHAWLMAGGNKGKKPATYEQVCKEATTFWPHDLETAELA